MECEYGFMITFYDSKYNTWQYIFWIHFNCELQGNLMPTVRGLAEILSSKVQLYRTSDKDIAANHIHIFRQWLAFP